MHYGGTKKEERKIKSNFQLYLLKTISFYESTVQHLISSGDKMYNVMAQSKSTHTHQATPQLVKHLDLALMGVVRRN